MTSLGSYSRNLAQQPTVKCSTCEADVQLSELADHQCPSPATGMSLGDQNWWPRVSDVEAVTHTTLTAEPREIGGQWSYDNASVPRRQRPSLPKIDSNMQQRSGRGLGPKEAASIAHDLGLPSPVSAGGGRRSPRPLVSRKGSSPRIPLAPPSPDLPLSQDCAFPPFPTSKPKRSNTQREVRTPKSTNSSRANTLETSLSHSASSSVYSTSSGGFAKRRTSDASSYPRSRQGTVNEALSPPSTAPSSPRTSVDGKGSSDRLSELERAASGSTGIVGRVAPAARKGSIEHSFQDSKSLLEHVARLPSGQTDDVVLDRSGSSTTDLQKSWTSDATHTPATFDNILTRSQSNEKKPSKRPPPLNETHAIAPEFQFAPLSARPSNASTTGGLGRSLTNLFSRKRSQSVSSKKAAKMDMDSLRMKALAPEPPPVPQRGHGEFGISKDDGTSYFARPTNQSSILAGHQDAISPLSASDLPVAHTDIASLRNVTVSPLSVSDSVEDPQAQKINHAHAQPRRPGFEFDFSESANLDERHVPENADRHEYEESSVGFSHSNSIPAAINIQRASIDSASSYGSLRYSQQTINSESTGPQSDDMRSKMLSALRDSYASFDLADRFPIRADEPATGHASTTPPTHGRLSPVQEDISTGWPSADPRPTSPDRYLPRSPPRSKEAPNQQTSPIRRPITPAGNKGTCRGCATTIFAGQKSMSSKDGRLSGRYHKECFACHTCRQPFATADFYVFDDQPYCSHHYHEVNNTLCTSCGKGIEGQYIETLDIAGNESKKFHAKCLTCTTCRIPLQEDYFEFQGRVYCERDAFRAASGPPRSPYDNTPSRPSPLVREYINSGEPGTKGRFPERRTTRLMMTA